MTTFGRETKKVRSALKHGRASDPIRAVPGTGNSFDKCFGKNEPLSKSA